MPEKDTPASGSTTPETPEAPASPDATTFVAKLVSSFEKLRKRDPKPGDLIGGGFVIAAFGLFALVTAILRPTLSSQSALVFALGVALVALGSVAVYKAVHLQRRWTTAESVNGNTRLSIDGPDQAAHIESLEVPHGTRGRAMWLATRIGERMYPHPIRVLDNGIMSSWYLGLGTEEDAGRRFHVGVYAVPDGSEKSIESYYEKAVQDGDYCGIPCRSWPKEAEKVFGFSCTRQSCLKPAPASATAPAIAQ